MIKRISIIIAGAALAVPALAASSTSTTAARGENHLRAAVLDNHNRARAEHGVSPLQWDRELAASAASHARYMARTGNYHHDRTPGRRKSQGENMWRGPRGVFGYDVIVGTMTDEVRHFRAGTFPNVSRSGSWHDVGHYTQIIWPATTHVGCAMASSGSTDYFVCRYSPPGNKDGRRVGR
ncbi:CAP domain-containing protein [Sphingomicrobium aestuariivivum]|uniref:CAP domain-containing protein n=1 Tax=Sphingomicrobium aestuariivivum TaxID=1582356 RepID=UPI001FD6DAA4|nr:CAP domain-containing protein [Sphingomicrobium aestuariivivum]MCJ8190256.1 CAP domain-containing protein [Sphingomicrobium aestuariivivum]